MHAEEAEGGLVRGGELLVVAVGGERSHEQVEEYRGGGRRQRRAQRFVHLGEEKVELREERRGGLERRVGLRHRLGEGEGRG